MTAAATVGGIWDTGGGSVAISGSALTLNGGVLNGGVTGIEMDNGAGNLTISASLALNNAQTWLNNSAGSLAVSAVGNGGHTLTIGGSGSDKISGAFSGAGGLTITGGSTSMTAVSTYTGATNVTAGTLNWGALSVAESTNSVNINPGATLLVTAGASGNALAAGNTAAPFTISGQLLKSSPTFFLVLGQANTVLSGGTIASLDTGNPNTETSLGISYGMAFENNGNFDAPVISTSANSGMSMIIVPSGGFFGLKVVGGSFPGQLNEPYFTSGANSTLVVNASFAQINDNINFENGVNVSGSGTVVFSPPLGQPNQYSHNTNIISGILQVANTGSIPSGTLGNGLVGFYSNVELDGGATTAGTLDLHGISINVNGLQGTSGAVVGTVLNSVTGTTATLTDLTLSGTNSALASGTTTYSGVLADGGGKLALAVGGTGSLTLTASNAFSGGATINSPGTLVLGSTATLGSGKITIASGGFLDVSNYTDPGYSITGTTLTAGRTTTPATDVNGSLNLTNAALVLNTGGTLTLSASNAATGSLSLTNGTLGYGPNNLVNLAGALSLGGTDYLSLTGLLVSSSNGTTYTLVTGNNPIAGSADWIVSGSTNSRQQYSVGTSGDNPDPHRHRRRRQFALDGDRR